MSEEEAFVPAQRSGHCMGSDSGLWEDGSGEARVQVASRARCGKCDSCMVR